MAAAAAGARIGFRVRVCAGEQREGEGERARQGGASIIHQGRGGPAARQQGAARRRRHGAAVAPLSATGKKTAFC